MLEDGFEMAAKRVSEKTTSPKVSGRARKRPKM